MRVLCDLPSLRTARVVRAIRRVLSLCCERGDFRLVHYSVQANHLHLIVEAHDKAALARGMKSVGARIARALNRVFGRKGAVLDGRYHAVALRSPQQVWRALRYVLLNVRHHAKRLPAVLRVDPASSGRWFAGWQQAVPEDDPIGGPREVADARTWLLQTGWSRHGPISLADVPG